METIPVDTRTFHHKLRPKKYRKPPEKAEMTLEEMRVFGKFHEAAARSIDNLACAIARPSPEQAEELDDRLEELVDRLEAIRYGLGLEGRENG